MAQGWTVDPSAGTITFYEPPATGTNNIEVIEYAPGGKGGTDCWALGAWNAHYGYPTEVEFFSDRLWFAATESDAQTIWGSQIGDYSNFGKSTPIIDSDAVSFAINTRQVNKVMDLVPLDKMIVLAKGGEFLMTGGQDEVITPSTIAIRPQSYRGTGDVQARVVGDTAVFVQEQGQRVFDIGYQFEQDGYRPTDISVWAEHLVEGQTILRMDWMPAPWSVLWLPRGDGKVIACTYMPEQDVIGWHQHDTPGEIIDVVCMPGDIQTETHVLVKRTINGQQKVYLEQLADYFVDDTRDWCYCDSALTYDGRNTTATTVTLTGSGWTEADTLTLTASSALFAGVSDVGDGFKLTSDDDSVRVVITTYVSSTVVEVQSVGTVPESLREVALTDWVLQRDTISGLDHLEGETVTLLVDGSVHPSRVVSGGAVSLAYPGGVVTAGLPYRAHVETLEVNVQGGEPMRSKKKLINKVNLLLKDSRGVKACSGVLNEDHLYELPQREFEDYGEPTQPITGFAKIPLSSQWSENSGRVHIISDDPLPCEILAIEPELMASD